ncbi:MAG: NADPH-dependent F420 reductase [Chloroflexota bacterium]|nr:NADPH-dependent F420 reductase [Chloroflexota bacterium]
MKIGIIGAGNIGEATARLLSRAGHAVAISNSRGPDSLTELVSEIGPGAQALSADDAASFGEVVLLAVPWRSLIALPAPERVAGKIVIDAMNPYDDNLQVIDLGDSSSSEETAKRLPGARVVKAFNTMQAATLRNGGQMGQSDRLALFVAGDDQDAKTVVSRLIDEIGFAAVDTGSLREGGRRQQPGSPLYLRDMTAAEAQQAMAD